MIGFDLQGQDLVSFVLGDHKIKSLHLQTNENRVGHKVYEVLASLKANAT